MLAAGLIFLFIVVGVCTLALCKAAGKDKYKDEYKDKWIKQRKKEKKFDGYKYCLEDCYACDYQGICKKSAMREL